MILRARCGTSSARNATAAPSRSLGPGRAPLRLVWRCGLQSCFFGLYATGAARRGAGIAARYRFMYEKTTRRRAARSVAFIDSLTGVFFEETTAYEVELDADFYSTPIPLAILRQTSPRRVPRQVPAVFFCSSTRGRGTLAESKRTDTHPACV